MKKLNFTTRTVLRSAASASLTLLAMVASAHAQTSVSHVIELRTGNDAGGNPLLPGANDGNITFRETHGCATSEVSRGQAMAGNSPKVVVPAYPWIGSLNSDPDARWVHSQHTPSGVVGTGLPSASVQYAHRFDLPLDMPMDANVMVEMEIAADDMVGAVSFGQDSSNTLSSMYFSGGGYSSSTSSTFSGTPTGLGLAPGENFLFVKQCDTAANFSGLIYSFTITIEYCVVELELRSGVIEGAAGPYVLNVGDTVPNVMQVPLSNGVPAPQAYNDLVNGNGSAATVINPHVNWVGSLTGGDAKWIHSEHDGSTHIYGSGRPPSAVLYEHEFLLPNIPSSATVKLELEWAADEKLYGVSINEDATSQGPGGELFDPVNTFGTFLPDFNAAQADQYQGSIGSAGLLGLNQGSNKLYLATVENYPAVSFQNNPMSCSGIMYIAKLTITYPCDSSGGDTPYESFCDCTLASDAPCANTGGLDQGCANSTGSGSSITSTGVAVSQSSSPPISTLTLHANNLPTTPQTVGIFIEGSNILSPQVPFGDGLRCIGHIKRLGVVFTSTGEASYTPFGNDIPANPGYKYYQLWYRDPLGPCASSFNLTNAIAVDWL